MKNAKEKAIDWKKKIDCYIENYWKTKRIKIPGQELPQILKFGDMVLNEKNNFAAAIRAYGLLFRQKRNVAFSQEAEKRLRELLGRCYNKLFLMYNIAIEICNILRDKRELIRLGDKCVNDGGVGAAYRAYIIAESSEKLIALGEKLQQNLSPFSWMVRAEDCFKAAAEIKTISYKLKKYWRFFKRRFTNLYD